MKNILFATSEAVQRPESRPATGMEQDRETPRTVGLSGEYV